MKSKGQRNSPRHHNMLLYLLKYWLEMKTEPRKWKYLLKGAMTSSTKIVFPCVNLGDALSAGYSGSFPGVILWILRLSVWQENSRPNSLGFLGGCDAACFQIIWRLLDLSHSKTEANCLLTLMLIFCLDFFCIYIHEREDFNFPFLFVLDRVAIKVILVYGENFDL